ncbi:hypothetical protein U9M48_012112 [Paspalum notatum var. saurae]|uniref:Uncharacterized protein n=1 Tax=Paspalum notatum var. saurae TaxID=547442 RepID=A0AAQ3WI75_PASNO
MDPRRSTLAPSLVPMCLPCFFKSGSIELHHSALEELQRIERMGNPDPSVELKLLASLQSIILSFDDNALAKNTTCSPNSDHSKILIPLGDQLGFSSALDEAIPHVPLADILNLGSELLHPCGHAVPINQHLKETPPRWLLKSNSMILEAVFNVVGHVTDLLHPGLDHLVVVLLLVCCHQEREHHLELICDESLITLDT